jgi:hypothetical protein
MAHPVHRSEKKREREKEQKVWACSKRSSFSQSACVIIILNVIVNVCRVVRMMPQLEPSLTIVILTPPEVLFILLELSITLPQRTFIIVQVSLMTIVIYDHHILIVQVDQWSLVVQDIFSAYTAAAKSWHLKKLFLRRFVIS